MLETDLAIIGAGVAGLTAATIAAQHGLSVLVIERMGAGGQVMNVEQVLNMPGFARPVSGFELGPQLQEQAEGAGAQFLLDTVERLEPAEAGVPGGRHLLHCSGETVSARAVLVAAGSSRRKLQVPGEEALEGRGVSHCASCDGPLFRGQPVVVVGGGDSAFGEALVLAAHASRVSIVFREAAPHAQHCLVQAAARLPNIELRGDTRVTGITGDEGVSGLFLQQRGEAERLVPTQGVFVYAGLLADAGFLQGQLKLDAQGRIETGANLCSSLPGVFAAGDIRAGSGYLLATAAGDGAAAARAAYRYLGGCASNDKVPR